jgi:hypothetical protein
MQRRFGYSVTDWPRLALLNNLFRLLERQLSRNGFIVNAGKMLDTSFDEGPFQWNPRDENEIIKEGEVPL